MLVLKVQRFKVLLQGDLTSSYCTCWTSLFYKQTHHFTKKKLFFKTSLPAQTFFFTGKDNTVENGMKTIKSLKYLQQITVLRNSSSFSNLKKIACKEGFLLQSTQEDSSFKKDAIDVTSSESVRERSAFYTA